jgi:regulator of sirC expression with transglutaminase-like and TPR domain
MTEPRRWDTLEKAGTFAFLSAGPCPPPGDLLLAIACEFRAVDSGHVSFRLDELARSLFAVVAHGGCRDGRAVSRRLAEVLCEEARFLSDESPVEGLLLDAVLDRREGHPLTLSVVAAEIGRRAGVPVAVCSTPTGWYAAIGDEERLWLIDPAAGDRPVPAGPVRRHCAHEVAFSALTGIYARLVRDGDGEGARRASELRGRLPVARHEAR